MTEFTLQTHRRTAWHFIPGFALSAIVTGITLQGGSTPAVADAGLSALTLTALLGIVLGNTVYPRIWKSCDGDVLFAKRHLLHSGIILCGFRLISAQIAGVGVSGIVTDVLTSSSTFLITYFLGQKVFSLDRHTSWLIGVGGSIYGTAAVLATESAIKTEASKVAVAIATVVIFGTIAIFLYPTTYPLLAHWFNPETYGIHIGSTIHEVVQIAVAGHTINPDAENTTVIVKMLRVIMLTPFLILPTARVRQLFSVTSGEKSRVTIPWFAILFIMVAVSNSFHLLSQLVADMPVTLDTILLTMAVAALGLTTHTSALKKVDTKSLLMVLLLFAWLIIGGGVINVAVHALVA